MTVPQKQDVQGADEYYGMWSGDVELSRTPSPGTPTKRMRMTLDDIADGFREEAPWVNNEYDNLLRANRTPESLEYDEHADFYRTLWVSSNDSRHTSRVGKSVMQTGCIPCLLAMSDDWNLNFEQTTADGNNDDRPYMPTPDSTSLTLFRPDTKWRRSWRERHSLNFFVNFSAPQMAGFFDSAFWQRMVIQTSYHEPAILHAITAIGALHECIMQRAFADEKRKARAIEFALNQCNRAIACLTKSQNAVVGNDFAKRSQRAPNSQLALTTCVLFTCFEAMQGRCDSAVNHALQGRRLLQATGRATVTSTTPAEQDGLEQMRPIVERLEVQATALLDKGRRPEVDTSDQGPPLPSTEFVYSLDHAHNILHTALNSVMRFMQGFHSTAPKDHITAMMTEKYLRYAPCFAKWEAAFTIYLADKQGEMSNMDLKRAMVLKSNHLVGTMLSSVDQSAGPVAYDAYEAEFRAIVDLSREVLAAFSCPPLPTLTGGSSGTPYLSFSLWVTDPLWMAISRCRNPSIRQAAFSLLSQNPRQEGIWHAGPQLSNNKYMRRVEAGPSVLKETVRGDRPPDASKRKYTRDVSVDPAIEKNRSSGEHETLDEEALPIAEKNGVPNEGAGSDRKVRAEWYADPSKR
ncbi:hypothetical protein LTR37_018760 [Vermiconidia calcicola]|uniref:Uncharacterized protein n=1 Tax=Vermiconidia calcicola TaxID=1690605 RepID=A0ACC3MG04_9PEZI|nr:hypothetical protein LTR37_018760 [Vermiconidia calcicola]